MNKKVIAGVIVVVVIAGVVGALVLNHKSNSNKPKSMSMSSSSKSTSNTVVTDAVTIKDFAFSPTTIKVKKGTKVTWTNQDSTAHTVTATSGGGFDSGSIAQGASFSFTFNTTGTFSYKCSFHPDMMGTVIVQDN